MHVTQVCDYMHVDYSREQENLFGRVRGLLLNQTPTAVRAKQLEAFHLSDVVHDLVLLGQVVPHALLDHITTCHVPSDGSLENHSVRPDLGVDLAIPAHPKV